MKLIKLALLSVVIFFLLLTGIGLLMPAQVRVSRAIDVQEGKEFLAIVADTATWKYWHPLFSGKTNSAAVHFTGKTDSSLALTVSFGTNTLNNSFTLHSYPHTQTQTLQWYQNVRSGWAPWQRLRSLLYEGTYGVFMEQGLKRLDSLHKSQTFQP